MTKKNVRRLIGLFSFSLTYSLLLTPAPAQQQQPAGVVTAVKGQAELTTPAAPKATLLRFREGVAIRDVIDTKEKSLARILFGGRSTVTVRELSRLEVREELLPGGGRRDVHDLSSGAILVNVAHQLMKPGDEVVIRTPNAVAAIRGSTIFASYNPLLNQSFFAQLSGNAVLNIQGKPTYKLVANTSNNGANVTGSGNNLQLNSVNVTQNEANQILSAEGQLGKLTGNDSNKGQVGDMIKEAAALVNAVADAVDKGNGGGGGGNQGQGQGQGNDNQPPKDQDPNGNKSKTAIDTSDATKTSACGASGNIVDNCGFETTNPTSAPIPKWDLTGSGSIITAMKDSSGKVVFAPTEGSNMAIIQTNTGNGAILLTGCATSVACDRSTLSQTKSINPGKSYLIKFDYNFMSNEFPTQSTIYNDTFTATAKDVGGGGSGTVLVTESRDSSSFTAASSSISTAGATNDGFTGFTLSSGNGYTGWKSASKTVLNDGNRTSGELEFKIEDFSDTVVASAVLIDNVSVVEDPPLYTIFPGQSLIGPDQSPLVSFTDQSSTFDSVLVAAGSGPNGTPSVSLSGPLMKAQNSSLNVPFSLLALTDNSRLVSTSSDPLVWLQGGNYSLSNLAGTSLFDLWGTQTTTDPDTGATVGSGQTIQTAGPLLQASDGASVESQKVLKIDTALLAATAPIINLLGTQNGQTTLTTDQSTMDLVRSKVTSNGPVVALDKSILNVMNGPLINLTSGSYMKVMGDLLSMLNGAKLNVLNGPLISAAGAGTTLNVSGALVNFGGTGGNKIVVNNNIAPTATMSGLPVSATYSGAVSIGPNPVKNPGLGSISVTGSLISATNGGKVTIQAK